MEMGVTPFHAINKFFWERKATLNYAKITTVEKIYVNIKPDIFHVIAYAKIKLYFTVSTFKIQTFRKDLWLVK
jgi:hypothetical protein